MNNIPYIDILILAMIAVFIINRLRNVLGKKTGNESDIVEKFTQRKNNFKESEPDSTSDQKVSKLDNNIDKNHHSNKKINSGQAVRIFTGAILPDGADRIILQEDVKLISDKYILVDIGKIEKNNFFVREGRKSKVE